ncbi:MAG: hypothetical protein WC649_00885 [Desulfobacteria bacterium]
MKKTIILTCLTLFLLMGMGICLNEPPPTPSKTSNHYQKQTTKDAKDSNNHQNLAIRSTHTDKATNKGDGTSLNRVMMWATIVIAICAFLQFIALIFQYCVMNKQDKTSRLRDRAYVYFADPILTPYPPDKPIVCGIVINVENTGNMPARHISIRFSWIASQHSEKIIDPFPLVNWHTVQVPSFIGPKQRFSLQGGDDIPINIIEEAKKFKIDVFILMEATYIDGFDLNKTRITQMSRSLRFDAHGSQSLGFAGPHNCTDDDCN